jgi:glycine dehydrogenase
VIATRAEPLGIEVRVQSTSTPTSCPDEYFGLHLQYPGASGAVRDHAPLVEAAHAKGALVTVAADLLGLCLLRAPGEIEADIAVGSASASACRWASGGPHAGTSRCGPGSERSLPGRLVGVSKDADGNQAYRLRPADPRAAHPPGEGDQQHLHRQVLLAVMASMYAVYHGPRGCAGIASRTHRMARPARGRPARRRGRLVPRRSSTPVTRCAGPGRRGGRRGRRAGVNCALVDADRSASPATRHDATTSARCWPRRCPGDEAAAATPLPPAAPHRDYLTHPVFHVHRSGDRHAALPAPAGGQGLRAGPREEPARLLTMKLQTPPPRWSGDLAESSPTCNPYAPPAQAAGYAELLSTLGGWLAELTGYDAVSVQPNAGSQGELPGCWRSGPTTAPRQATAATCA